MPTPTSPHAAPAPRATAAGRTSRRAARPRPHRTGPAPRTARGAGTLVRLLMVTVLAAGALVAGAGPASAAPAPPVPPVPFTTAPDAPSRYQGQVSCSDGETPGAAALRELIRTAYGRANTGGVWRPCGQGGTSEHKEGRAYDWMKDAADPADKALVDAFLAWLVGPDAQGVAAGNARRLGVQYVIWDRRTWQSWTGAWKPYTGASPHTDHVHISLSWDGAYKRTSWWTGRAVTQVDQGPCRIFVGEPVPPYSGPRYGPCPAPVTRESVPSGSSVHAGQLMLPGTSLTSPDGGYAAVMQGDGNFVMYRGGSRAVWHTRSHGSPGARLVMQDDGNLVVYSPSDRPLWWSGTQGNPGARVVFQDDGNVVVYRLDDRALWASGIPSP